jgi:hypothetical protein
VILPDFSVQLLGRGSRLFSIGFPTKLVVFGVKLGFFNNFLAIFKSS